MMERYSLEDPRFAAMIGEIEAKLGHFVTLSIGSSVELGDVLPFRYHRSSEIDAATLPHAAGDPMEGRFHVQIFVNDLPSMFARFKPAREGDAPWELAVLNHSELAAKIQAGLDHVCQDAPPEGGLLSIAEFPAYYLTVLELQTDGEIRLVPVDAPDSLKIEALRSYGPEEVSGILEASTIEGRVRS